MQIYTFSVKACYNQRIINHYKGTNMHNIKQLRSEFNVAREDLRKEGIAFANLYRWDDDCAPSWAIEARAVKARYQATKRRLENALRDERILAIARSFGGKELSRGQIEIIERVTQAGARVISRVLAAGGFVAPKIRCARAARLEHIEAVRGFVQAKLHQCKGDYIPIAEIAEKLRRAGVMRSSSQYVKLCLVASGYKIKRTSVGYVLCDYYA